MGCRRFKIENNKITEIGRGRDRERRDSAAARLEDRTRTTGTQWKLIHVPASLKKKEETQGTKKAKKRDRHLCYGARAEKDMLIDYN